MPPIYYKNFVSHKLYLLPLIEYIHLHICVYVKYSCIYLKCLFNSEIHLLIQLINSAQQFNWEFVC